MRRSALLRQSGPYKVESRANGALEVTPTWPQYQPFDPEEGGGPGVFSRMALARQLEEFLNATHPLVSPPQSEEAKADATG